MGALRDVGAMLQPAFRLTMQSSVVEEGPMSKTCTRIGGEGNNTEGDQETLAMRRRERFVSCITGGPFFFR